MRVIFPIVEGHGEERAFPSLLRRILQERLGLFTFSITNPYRLSRGVIVGFGEKLRRVIELGRYKIGDSGGLGGIVILVDADDDCPAELSARFRSFAERVNVGVPVSFVAANREYESWFIACAEQMREHQFVKNDARSHPSPETIRDAKGYLVREILKPNQTYSETIDQDKLTHAIKLDCVIERSRSFRKLEKEIRGLFGT